MIVIVQGENLMTSVVVNGVWIGEVIMASSSFVGGWTVSDMVYRVVSSCTGYMLVLKRCC